MAATPREVVILWTEEVWKKGGVGTRPTPRPGTFDLVRLAHKPERGNAGRALVRCHDLA